ncbi:unnamed protein product [Rhizoctonia solani]|uniref:Alpha/beta hydrolase fold-3 domain-containing protein n=1 Tax=Rhizoctonia solani TaxID=456999 RepID=A0A8H3DPJ8_9AGAM|nr:unnamed protein product [Rhizoctonia solani]
MSSAAESFQSVRDQLDPEYREFVQSTITSRPPLHKLQWSSAIREAPRLVMDLGTTTPVEVGSKRAVNLGDYSVEVMIPPGEKPSQGWPVVLYVHGGGWVFGDASMDDEILSKACIDIQCATVSVDYRLAPEHPFPAGLDDAWNALIWLSQEGGGNIAAVVAQRASLASPPILLVYQALLIPAIDLSFSVDDRSRWTPSMVEHENIWSMPALNLFWFRDLYVPNVHDRTIPEVSPCFQEDKSAFEGMPPTWISVAELDTLCSEGKMYAAKLRTRGVSVTLKTLKGLPHTGLKANRVCNGVRNHHDELIEALRGAFSGGGKV